MLFEGLCVITWVCLFSSNYTLEQQIFISLANERLLAMFVTTSSYFVFLAQVQKKTFTNLKHKSGEKVMLK